MDRYYYYYTQCQRNILFVWESEFNLALGDFTCQGIRFRQISAPLQSFRFIGNW